MIGLVNALVNLVIFLGVVAVGQIAFCLARWRGFRLAESKINPKTPKPDRWWWIFETAYMLAIAFSIYQAWRFKAVLPDLIQAGP